jgi:hypothetical protein
VRKATRDGAKTKVDVPLGDVDTHLIGTDTDPVMLAATAWLGTQPGCTR